MRAIFILFLFFLMADTRAQVTFVNRATELGIDHYFENAILMGGGAAFFDYDLDGDEDIWINGGQKRDVLYRNNGDGSYTDVSNTAGIDATASPVTVAVVTGDTDNDGDREVFVTTEDGFPNIFFLNNGDGTFTDISEAAGLLADTAWSTSASFGDIDLDGYLDLYVGNYIGQSGFTYDSLGIPNGFAHKGQPNFFYLNDQNNGFIEMSEMLGLADTGCVLATAFTDFDRDADVDMFIANDFGEWVVPNQLLRNDYLSTGQFTNVSASSGMDAGMYGMGIAIGDYDRDHDLDYYVTNIGRNGLFQNQGDGQFLDVTTGASVEDIYVDSLLTVGWGTAFIDVDNDGWLDLYVTNGFVPAFDFIQNDEENPNRLYMNRGDGSFEELGAAAGVDDPGIGRGFACSDIDEDGDVDLLVMVIDDFITTEREKILVYENQLDNDNNWLKVSLEGTVSNRDAYGAQVDLFAGGYGWVAELNGGSSHASQNSSILHFGLGDLETVDSLIVTWPNGWQQLLYGVAANQTIRIVEDTSSVLTYADIPGSSEVLLNFFPNPVQDVLNIQIELKESSPVRLDILDIRGQVVRSLCDATLGAGRHQWYWNGQSESGSLLPEGLYLLRLKTAEGQQLSRIVRQ